MINCHSFKKSISNYIDEQLSERARRSFEQHLASCDSCRSTFEDLKQITHSLHSLPRPKTSASFDLVLHARLRQQIRAETAEGKSIHVPAFASWLKIPAFAAMAALLIFMGAALQRYYGTTSTQVAVGQADPQLQKVSKQVGETINVDNPGYVVVTKMDTINNKIVIVNYLDMDQFAPSQQNMQWRRKLTRRQGSALPDLREAPSRGYSSPPAEEKNAGIQLAKEYVF